MGAATTDLKSLLGRENITLDSDWGKAKGLLLAAAGLVAMVATCLIGIGTDTEHATLLLGAYHTGAMVALGLPLGAMIFVMILHQVAASWAAVSRRQLEHIMAMLPWAVLLLVPSLVSTITAPGALWDWMGAAAQDDYIYKGKAVFLNRGFFLVRAGLYIAVWIGLSRTLLHMSRKQDADGDPRWTIRMRKLSAFGIVLFALTLTFAGFDWVMSLDFYWFSTMFGVYMFAAIVSPTLALWLLIQYAIQRAGRLQGLVTVEHTHDTAKLIFGFSCFWGYIGFSQYFLIWYANIPEETAWYVLRRDEVWMPYSILLLVGRFVVPFLLLLPRPCKRNPKMVGVVCVWLLLCYVLDFFWIIRPAVAPDTGMTLMDAVAIAGPALFVLGMLSRKIGSSVLIPQNDPRLKASVSLRNYV